jgi:SAM-dependent methyltransferase
VEYVSKVAEQNYLAMTGDAGWSHSIAKPFSDTYCGVNLASIGTIMTLLPEPPTRILDMGCGGGWTSIFFAKRGYDVVGQDIAKDMISLANQNKAEQRVGNGLSFVCSDYETSSFREEFDAVVFYDCLHHAEDERAALASAYRALKPGAILVTHEPGEGHSIAPGSLEAMRLYGVNERDMPPHLILRHARELGFRSGRVYPMQHDLMRFFYGESVPPLLSRKGRARAKRALRLAFRPSHRASALVVCTK